MHKLTVNNSEIPQFTLYGGFSKNETKNFIHFEKIRDRSSLSNWVINPHRHNKLFQIVCVFSGEFEVQFDGRRQKYFDGSLITIPSGTVHGFRFEPGTLGYVLSISTDLMWGSDNFKKDLLDKDILLQMKILNIEHDSSFKKKIKSYFNLIRLELENNDDDHIEVLCSLLNILFLLIKNKIKDDNLWRDNNPIDVNFINAFRSLINDNYKKQWKVGDYAEAMSMSVSTLCRLCKSSLGHSPKYLIQERLIAEAKRELVYTSLPITEIALSLGFKSPAYFSRIFSKVEKVSPFKFRVSKFRVNSFE